MLVLIGGNRDAMSFYENIGLPVCALASETANVSEQVLSQINQIADKVIVLYDNDAAGLKKAEKFEQEHGFIPANFIYAQFKGTNPDGTANDFVDFYKNNPGMCDAFHQQLQLLIENGRK